MADSADVHVHVHHQVDDDLARLLKTQGRDIRLVIASVRDLRLLVAHYQELHMAALSDLRDAQGATAVAIGAVFTEVVETASKLAGLRTVITTLTGLLDEAQANAVDQEAVDAALAAVDRLNELAAQLDAVQQDPENEIPVEPEPLDELPPVEPVEPPVVDPPPAVPVEEEPFEAPFPEPPAGGTVNP